MNSRTFVVSIRRPHPNPLANYLQRVRDRAARRARVLLWPSVDSADRCQITYSSSRIVSEQPKAAGAREGIRQTLQYGSGKRQGDVD